MNIIIQALNENIRLERQSKDILNKGLFKIELNAVGDEVSNTLYYIFNDFKYTIYKESFNIKELNNKDTLLCSDINITRFIMDLYKYKIDYFINNDINNLKRLYHYERNE